MKSMTGFGRGTAAAGEWTAAVEISSVNRKQAEIVVQAPRELAALEVQVRKAVAAHVSRGRVQVSINVSQTAEEAGATKVDVHLARQFSAAFRKLSDELGTEIAPVAADFLRVPGIIGTPGANMEAAAAWPAVEAALAAALLAFLKMRADEGAHLREDFHMRLAMLEQLVAEISLHAPHRPIRQRELLFKRLADVGLGIDLGDERVLKELALYADRCDITEEITRLASHFAKFRGYLAAEEPPGRSLDFLCQEIFREFNTIGSKANDPEIAQIVVAAKTELEKIREQVQNVE